MYNVIVSPDVSDTLINYAGRITSDNGKECGLQFVDSYDNAVNSLEELP